jgi:hypothetical protein
VKDVSTIETRLLLLLLFLQYRMNQDGCFCYCQAEEEPVIKATDVTANGQAFAKNHGY